MFTRNSLTVILSTLLISCSGQQSIRKTVDEMIFSNSPFRECHASSIVEISPGRFLAAAFGGTEEGNKDVCIWSSEYSGGHWNSPGRIADGVISDSLRYPCWNPVLFKERSGILILFYKTGPSPREWWGVAKRSFDNGKTWSRPEKLSAGILGPIKNKPLELPDGTIISGSSSETGGNWKVHMERSNDGGKTWQYIPVDPYTEFQVIQPTILVHPGPRLQILCRSKNDVITEAFSDDDGLTWSRMTATAIPNPNSGIDAVSLKDGRYLLVYNPLKRGGEDRAKLAVALSSDGRQWKNILMLEDKTSGEFSYPAIIQSYDGRVHITYTFNRVNIKHVVLELGRQG